MAARATVRSSLPRREQGADLRRRELAGAGAGLDGGEQCVEDRGAALGGGDEAADRRESGRRRLHVSRSARSNEDGGSPRCGRWAGPGGSTEAPTDEDRLPPAVERSGALSMRPTCEGRSRRSRRGATPTVATAPACWRPASCT
ncbi:hypothetical protein HBB16_16070 [Pseudonocardia sp. MCCB 268]|nr:hypothetical protein [Pseudonocardia cytotoxica]